MAKSWGNKLNNFSYFKNEFLYLPNDIYYDHDKNFDADYWLEIFNKIVDEVKKGKDNIFSKKVDTIIMRHFNEYL